MKQTMPVQILTIYVGEDDKWRGGLLYPALVERLKEAGLSGVTVLHGIEGYGAHGKLHTARFEVLFSGLPLVISAVDTTERIAAVLPLLDEMIGEGLVTLQDAQAIRYTRDG